MCKLRRGHSPHWENWLQSRVFQLLLPVCPYVSKEEIAESDMVEPRLNSSLARFFHDVFVVSIRAWLRQIHAPQGDACRLCLRLDEATPHRVHGHPVRHLIECRQQPDDFVFILLLEKVEAPRTGLSTAPRQQRPFHVNVGPCSPAD